MNREEAFKELQERLTNANLIKHSLAVEAIMRGIAIYFKEDYLKWGLAGLLHDIDYDETAKDPSKHSIVGAEILESLEIDDTIVYAVKAHNDYHGLERKRKIDKASFSADPISGLITACALILPLKRLGDVTVEFVLKRMDEKGFAKGANRDHIKKCIELGLSLEEFTAISLDSMKSISNQLGL